MSFQGYKESFDKVYNDVWGKACNELHSLMVVKDGNVIYERWAPGHLPDELHILWSASKTFTAVAVGFAVQEGCLSLNDRLTDFLEPDEFPDEQSDWFRQISIYDLLIMSSGIGRDNISRSCSNENYDWVKETLSSGVIFEPGTRFRYNSMDTYLLSVVVSRATGLKLADYLEDRMFRHLGIKEYIWVESPQGFNAGGWGLHLSTESLAKAGLFFLNRGLWNGKRLLDESWFDMATSPQILQYVNNVTDPVLIEKLKKEDHWNQGYGFQMWMNFDGGYRFDGAWGQFVYVMPDKNAVVVATSHTGDTPILLNSIRKNIYEIL